MASLSSSAVYVFSSAAVSASVCAVCSVALSVLISDGSLPSVSSEASPAVVVPARKSFISSLSS